jgi:hypothetical protein
MGVLGGLENEHMSLLQGFIWAHRLPGLYSVSLKRMTGCFYGIVLETKEVRVTENDAHGAIYIEILVFRGFF